MIMDNFVLVLLGFVFLTIFLAIYVFFKSKRRGLSKKDHNFIVEKWEGILKIAENDARYAILDADKLLDYLLGKKGYEGHLGEKLKKASNLFSDLNGIWLAHKLRNKIAHELDIVLRDSEVNAALRSFKKAIRDLGIKL